MRFRLSHSVIAIVGSLGCTAAAEHSPQRSAPNAAATGTVAAGTVAVDSQPPAATAVRALYVNRWASQSRKRMTKPFEADDHRVVFGWISQMDALRIWICERVAAAPGNYA